MHQVRYFLAVCEELNFTRAAERCGVAQPSLTKAVKLLEEELGGPLFRRERANTHLSELGRMVLPYMEQILAKADAVAREIQERAAAIAMPIRLGIMCTVAPLLVIDLIDAVRSNHPDVDLQLVDASARILQERLHDGTIDAAIFSPPNEIVDDRLHYLPLFREQFMIAVSEGHRLAPRNSISVADLDGEFYINRINCEIYDFAAQKFTARNVNCPMIYRSERDDWVLAMIAAGLGFGFMPQYTINHPGVVGRPCVDPEFYRQVSLVTVRGRAHTPATGIIVQEAVRAPWTARLQPSLDACA
jgi:DNA-binding transcriptional LysR family regulator